MAGNRVSVTIDGKKFKAIRVVYGASTQKDKNGKPLLESYGTKVNVWADISDQKQFPFATLSSFFELANVVTSDKFKPMKVEFWKEDKAGDVICSMQFKGWIGKLEIYNPDTTQDTTGSSGGTVHSHGGLGAYNNILYLELEPLIDSENHGSVKLTN